MKMLSLLVAGLCLASLPTSAEPMPAGLAGSWKITRVLRSADGSCWDPAKARPLVGSTLVYRSGAMTWRGGKVPLEGVVTRSVTPKEFRKENAAFGVAPGFEELGIHAPRVTEVDLQHEDADITGATTEVPGDSVLMVAPNRIVVSACGVFYEASRAGAVTLRAAEPEPNPPAAAGTSARRRTPLAMRTSAAR